MKISEFIARVRLIRNIAQLRALVGHPVPFSWYFAAWDKIDELVEDGQLKKTAKN